MADPNVIPLRGVRVHNLQGVDVDVPLGKLTVVTGVSGAGKSSLVFDTLNAEAQRRFLQGFSAYTRQFLERFDRPDADHIGDLPPAVAVGHKPVSKHGRAVVGTLADVLPALRQLFVTQGTYHCPRCARPLRPEHTVDVVEFLQSLAVGTKFTVAFPLKPDADDWAQQLREEGFVRVQIVDQIVRLDQPPLPTLSATEPIWVLVDRLEVGPSLAGRAVESIETAILRGQGRMAILRDDGQRVFDQRWACEACDLEVAAPSAEMLDYNDPRGACQECQGTGELSSSPPLTMGGPGGMALPHNNPPRPPLRKGGRGYSADCAYCQGTRLGEAARTMRLAGKTLADLWTWSLTELAGWITRLPATTERRSAALREQLTRRLDLPDALLLGYLTLGRRADTLATGEVRRLALVQALSANLAEALYLFDEPTAGLHARERGKVVAALQRLRDGGNTVVVVDHAREVFVAADHVIDLGPGAGEEGGRVVYQGPPAGLASCAGSVTAQYFFADQTEARSHTRRKPSGWLRLTEATTHNLQNLTVDFPLGVLCAVTGVSGAGKSSLVEDTLVPALAKSPNVSAKLTGASQVQDVVFMDQSPLPRSARSNPATLLKIYDDIREVFAETTDARIRNLGPGAFSFNQPGGRCETCQGQGTLAVDMQFLADAVMTCPECQGARFTRPVLTVKVRGLSIAEVLNLTVREAFRFFRAQPGLQKKLKTLLDVGLDYLRLGQATEMLSGGEAQRLKLASRLAARRKPRTLFVLSEPTIGLHPADVEQLIGCISRLVDEGHSVLVVENNEDMIRAADHVIELEDGKIIRSSV